MAWVLQCTSFAGIRDGVDPGCEVVGGKEQ